MNGRLFVIFMDTDDNINYDTCCSDTSLMLVSEVLSSSLNIMVKDSILCGWYTSKLTAHDVINILRGEYLLNMQTFTIIKRK